MASDTKPPEKKDFTGILDMAQLEPQPTDASDANNPASDALNIEQPVEKVESFEALTDLGMMDHPVTQTFSGPSSGAPQPTYDQIIEHNDLTSMAVPPTTVELGFQSLEGSTEVILPEAIPGTEQILSPSLDSIREYSENAKGIAAEAEINYPFHFYAEGAFGYYERDKLLRFITENSVGITSAEIDLQIQAGRVLIPRISEYAGIKLVQELRDSPLSLRLFASDRDADETTEHQPADHFQFDAQGTKPSQNTLVIIDPKSPDRSGYIEIGQLQASQFLKAEMVEAEKSELFQELLARMTESLKNRARFKGAEAMTQPVTQVINLRLPSQYQVVLTTSLLKRKVNA